LPGAVFFGFCLFVLEGAGQSKLGARILLLGWPSREVVVICVVGVGFVIRIRDVGVGSAPEMSRWPTGDGLHCDTGLEAWEAAMVSLLAERGVCAVARSNADNHDALKRRHMRLVNLLNREFKHSQCKNGAHCVGLRVDDSAKV
jgi:hypothetical protein